MDKIAVESELVVLHGDEMAQVAFEQILNQFVKSKLDIPLVEIDLSAENRLRTNGKIVEEAIAALKKYKVGLKNAGITVNKAQKEAFLKDMPELDGNKLAPLATKSPNGAIRKGINGNITREDIPFTNLKPLHPDWQNVDLEVVTMEDGGQKDSYNEVSEHTGYLKVLFTKEDGALQELHTRLIHKGDPWLVATNDIEKVRGWAKKFFQRAVDEKKDAYVGLKDTVIPGYDGVMKDAVEKVYHDEFEAQFKKLGLKYSYGLIDAQAAQMVVSPPENALWGIPDNTTGRKLLKMVQSLKRYGLPYRMHQKSISRMSAGGGDQYGSFNMGAPDDGILKVCIDGKEIHAREVKKGDPIILQSNEAKAIDAWIKQFFREATEKKQEIYIGLKAQYMAYDMLFSDLMAAEYNRLLKQSHDAPPTYMVMLPSAQLQKLIVDPPMNACYPALNLDGDIFSDITAALGGSLATASSIIASPEENGVMLFEAPHGTAPDLYVKYKESGGKVAIFNSSALFYAVANALEVLARREHNKPLLKYSDAMKAALIKTVEQGTITGDIKGKTNNPDTEKVVDMYAFLDAIEENLLV